MKSVFVCLFVCLCAPPGPEGPKTGRKAQNWAKVPETGLKAPKLGLQSNLGVFHPHTDQDYAGCRPALIEFKIFGKAFVFFRHTYY